MQPTLSAREKRLVTVIPGDGIGPEVVRAAHRVVEAIGDGKETGAAYG